MIAEHITYEIRGAAYDVYKALGPGLLESVYQEAMAYEMRKRGLKVDTQVPVPIFYDGKLLNTDLRLDMLVDDTVIVELKSVLEMKNVFRKQLLTYLRLSNKPVGLLINFTTDDITKSITRIVN